MKRIISLAMVLALMMVAAMPTAIRAETATDDTTITGNVPVSITITTPVAGFSMPSLVPGTTVNTESSPKSITIATNTTGWNLTVIENGETPDGQMSGTPGTLANTFQVKGGDQATYTSVGSSVSLETSGTVGGATINNINFQQQVASDAAAGDYTITLTFTATSGT